MNRERRVDLKLGIRVEPEEALACPLPCLRQRVCTRIRVEEGIWPASARIVGGHERAVRARPKTEARRSRHCISDFATAPYRTTNRGGNLVVLER